MIIPCQHRKGHKVDIATEDFTHHVKPKTESAKNQISVFNKVLLVINVMNDYAT